MKKESRVVLILVVLFLAACTRSQVLTDMPPTHTEGLASPQPSLTETTLPPPPTKFPTFTPLPPSQTPEPVPPSPTAQAFELGEPFPLLAPGSEITLKYVELVTADMGWGIAPGADGIGHILRTDDGGETWREISPPQPLTPYSFVLEPAVHFRTSDQGWVSYSGTDLIWTTRDGGRTWQPSQLEYTAFFGGDIHNLDNNQVWFFQYVDAGMMKIRTVIYSSSDGGNTWTKLLDPYTDVVIQGFEKTGIDFINPQYGWLTRDFWGVISNPSLEITKDGGKVWESIDIPPPPSASNLYDTCMCALHDPRLFSESVGSLRMSCQCGTSESPYFKNYLYSTGDGGGSWEVEYIPEGDFHYISPRIFYVVGREIYRSDDIGVNWDFVKTVYWDGQLSFVGNETALGIAHCTDDDEAALVRTVNGCKTFELIEPKLLPSFTER